MPVHSGYIVLLNNRILSVGLDPFTRSNVTKHYRLHILSQVGQ